MFHPKSVPADFFCTMAGVGEIVFEEFIHLRWAANESYFEAKHLVLS
jgi:hypothetical protein